MQVNSNKIDEFYNKAKLIFNSSNKTEILELIVELLNFYFSNGRPKNFRDFEQKIDLFYPEVLNLLQLNNGVLFSDRVYLFKYTLSKLSL